METQTAETKGIETLSAAEIIKSLSEDKIKVEYDAEKFSNNEDLKKISKKQKKVQKEIATILESNGDVKDKLTEVFSRFQKLVNDTKGSHERYYQFSKDYTKVAAEKEKSQQEYAKSQNVNATLEGLCKSLQKQNQDLIDENKKLQNDEKEVRSKLASDFQTRINTISSELEKHATEHLRKTKENELIREKLKEVAEKFESREKIFGDEYQNRDKKFEDHYQEIQEKFKAISDEADKLDEYTAEYEKTKGETDQVTGKLTNLTEKSEAFQNLMAQTNSFFGKIKTEMDKVGLKNKKLDDENIQLQKKSENSSISIFEMVEENVFLHKEITKAESQREGLQKVVSGLETSLKEKTDKIKAIQG